MLREINLRRRWRALALDATRSVPSFVFWYWGVEHDLGGFNYKGRAAALCENAVTTPASALLAGFADAAGAGSVKTGSAAGAATAALGLSGLVGKLVGAAVILIAAEAAARNFHELIQDEELDEEFHAVHGPLEDDLDVEEICVLGA